jgi:hypothetical protein
VHSGVPKRFTRRRPDGLQAVKRVTDGKNNAAAKKIREVTLKVSCYLINVCYIDLNKAIC